MSNIKLSTSNHLLKLKITGNAQNQNIYVQREHFIKEDKKFRIKLIDSGTLHYFAKINSFITFNVSYIRLTLLKMGAILLSYAFLST